MVVEITSSSKHKSLKEYIAAVFVEDYLKAEMSFNIDDTIDGFTIIYDGKKITLPDVFFSTVYENQNITDPILEYIHVNQEKLVAWYTTENNAEYTLPVDIFGMAFFLMSGYADITLSRKDSFDRFMGLGSFVEKNDLIDRPIIQEWFFELAKMLLSAEELTLLDNGRFRKHISHDVDQPFEYLNYSFVRLIKRVGGDLVVRNNPAQAFRRMRIFAKVNILKEYKVDPYNNFNELIELLNEYKTNSTFFFVASENTHQNDVRYTIEHPAVIEIISKVHSMGHNIGIHPSFKTLYNPDLLKSEVTRLNTVLQSVGMREEVKTSRKHYLRWDWENSPESLANAGVKEDYSVGYADRSGFRVGVAFPYRAFSWHTKTAVHLKIHPLIIMECSLTAPGYMGLSYLMAEEKVMKYFSYLNKIGGELVVLWHNHMLLNKEDIRLFKKILEL